MYGALRRLMFRLDAERAHHVGLRALKVTQRMAPLRAALGAAPPDARLRSTVMGLDVPAPLGLAAGFDKGAEVYNALLGLGFGHVEVGTVTPRPQPGNDGKRIERHAEQKALVNRLGFPGPGMIAVAERLRAQPPVGIVGANIGPNKTTAPDLVVEDLRAAAMAVAPRTSFVAINVSSPNTPGLRELQQPASIAKLVASVLVALDVVRARRPLLVKLHPDATDDQLLAVSRAAVDAGARGVIATNTTRARPPGLEGAMEGGLSGAPLRDRARQAIAALYRGLRREVPIIGVGGILTADDAWGHIRAGASLVQAYTGFIYDGPRFPVHIHRGLLDLMDAARIEKISDAVGTAPPT